MDTSSVRVTSPSYQAYQILHVAYTAAPIAAGLDKFAHFLVNWDQYLSPLVPQTLGMSAHRFMMCVGAIEVFAGLLVAVAPRLGAWAVAFWLCAIVVNLLSMPAYFDVALRDFWLALGAFAFARLAVEYSE
jgi:hypothetical protein